MALADELLPIVYSARAIAGSLGFRPHAASLLIRRYEGTTAGEGPAYDTETPVTEANGQAPKVRWLSDEERALGGLGPGVIEVGPITPEFSGGGTELAGLKGAELSTSDSRFIRITGPMHPSGALYRVISVNAQKSLRIMVRAEPVANG